MATRHNGRSIAFCGTLKELLLAAREVDKNARRARGSPGKCKNRNRRVPILTREGVPTCRSVRLDSANNAGAISM